jgi:3-hydroxybutyryl-CoA dehydrogenase
VIQSSGPKLSELLVRKASISALSACEAADHPEVVTSKDSPGFIANAILMPMVNEAIMVLEKVRRGSVTCVNLQGTASAEHIDTTFRLGMGHPMGPLRLADLIGLDTCLSIQRVLHNETGDSKYRPSGLLVRMVDAGWVGEKVGKGFYDYSKK